MPSQLQDATLREHNYFKNMTHESRKLQDCATETRWNRPEVPNVAQINLKTPQKQVNSTAASSVQTRYSLQKKKKLTVMETRKKKKKLQRSQQRQTG